MKHHAPRRLSDVLVALAQRDGERITMGELVQEMRGRAFGLALAVFALPETIPMVGLSLVLAIPIAAIGGFMLVRGEDTSLPGWLRRRSLRRAHVEAAVRRVLPALRWVERRSRPRWFRLATACRLQGAVCVLMAVILAIPLPGINILAAVGVFGTGAGMVLRDGRIVAIAFASATFAALGLAGIIFGAVVLAA